MSISETILSETITINEFPNNKVLVKASRFNKEDFIKSDIKAVIQDNRGYVASLTLSEAEALRDYLDRLLDFHAQENSPVEK